MKRLIILVAVCVFGAEGVWGQLQGFRSSMPMLAKSAFGVIAVNTPDVANLSVGSFNPASLVGAFEYRIDNGVEVDFGTVNFDLGPRVQFNVETLLLTPGKVAVRLRRYGVNSGSAPTPFTIPPTFTEPLNVEFNGFAYELSAGFRVDRRMSVGIALVPAERITTSVRSARGVSLSSGRGRTNFQGRVGFLHWENKRERRGEIAFERPQLVYGLVFAWDTGRSQTTNNPAFTGLDVPITLRGRYRNFAINPAVTYFPTINTSVTLGYQRYRLSGTDLDENIDIFQFNVEHFLIEQLAIRAGTLYGSLLFGIRFIESPRFQIGATFAANGFRGIRRDLGRSDAFYFYLFGSF